MQNIIDNLNPSQQEAVKYIDGPMLILAGAGSGKTKTITTRLSYLIAQKGVAPEHTLTLTFTNKSALEMKQRAFKLIPSSITHQPLLCTFHKFGLLFLKQHISLLQRDKNFVIIDSADKKHLLKKIAKTFQSDLSLSFIASEISKYKNYLLSPNEVLKKAELMDYQKVASIYKAYQTEIKKNNLVDFDDLLMLTYKILKQNPILSKKVSHTYRYIMVDEYQDTNELQFQLLKLLASQHQNLCVVGDDDQSIYGWRHAKIENILNFNQQFKACKVIKLETNYRSTSAILECSNQLISHNSLRLGKKLISHKGEGQPVRLLHSFDESIEASTIALEIKKLLKEGVLADEIVVLYRLNALSRSLEEGFLKENLGFKLIGGMRFYERSEIKDIIAYLRLISNFHDDFSLLRIINKPKCGIGESSLEKLKHLSLSLELSLFGTLEHIIEEKTKHPFSPKIVSAFSRFYHTIKKLYEEFHHNKKNFIQTFDETIALKSFYIKHPDSMDKLINIDEFYGYLTEAIETNPNLILDEFLNSLSLESEQDQIERMNITIMSIHASKGLEFEYVFVIGLEEEFFPILGEKIDIEEERRLGYVAMTRAKSHLILSYVDSRYYQGKRKMLKKSRFLAEAGLIKKRALQMNKHTPFKKGDLVKNSVFGIGIIQAVNQSGKEYKLLINFDGIKKEILSSYVRRI